MLLFPCAIKAQVITLFAGGGTGVDGTPAITASVFDPNFMTFDAHGSFYFAENSGNKVRKIDSAGIISTLAGTGAFGFSGDSGLATLAKLNQTAGVAVDTLGNVFIADAINNRIRRVDAITHIITTIAGNSTAGFGGDSGLASAATLYQPSGICFDKSGSLYIGDYGNHRIRKINASGIITTVAGNGSYGWGGNGGQATAAKITPVGEIFIDTTGNIYFTEWTYGTIRMVNTAGIILLVAGDTSSHVYNGDGIPATNAHIDPFGVAINDSGVICFSDVANNRIRLIDASGIIHTLAGTGIAGNTGDNGPADSAEIHTPNGVAIDHCGSVYLGQVNTPRIRKINFPGTLPSISITTSTSAAPGDTIAVAAAVTHGCCPSYTISWMNHGVVFATGVSTSYIKGSGTDSITAKLIGCGDTAVSALHVVTNSKVGIPIICSSENSVKLYPNPASGELTITATDKMADIAVCNLLGQVILTTECNVEETKVNMVNLRAGLYLVKVTFTDGSVIVRKIVKQ